MPDNLVVNIVGDASKLRAELTLAQADLKKFGAELKKAGDAADIARVDRLSETFEAQRARVQFLSQQMAGLGRAHTELREKMSELREPIAQIREGFAGLSERTFPGFREIFALSIGAATTELVKFTTEAARATQETTDLAETFGATATQIQALKLAAATAGAPVDALANILGRFARQVGEQREIDWRKFWGVDPTKTALEELNIDIRSFDGTIESTLNLTKQLVTGIDAITDPARRANVAFSLLGKSWQESLRVLRAYQQAGSEFQKNIRAWGLETEKAEEENATAYLKALNVLQFVYGRMKEIVGGIIGEGLTPLFGTLTRIITNNMGTIRQWAEGTRAILLAFGRDIQTLFAQGTGAKFETEGMRIAVLLLQTISIAAKALIGDFRLLEAAINALLAPINALFGTNLSGRTILLTVAIFNLVGVFKLLGSVLAAARAAQVAYNIAMAANPVVFLVVAITAAIAILAAFAYMFRHEIADAVTAAWNAVKGFADYLWQGFLAVVGTVAGAVKAAWDAVFNWFAEKFAWLSGLMEKLFGDAAGARATAAIPPAAPQGQGQFARGGYVGGSSTGDTVPAMLTPGEFVTRAAAVRHYGAEFFHALNQQRLPQFDLGGLVDAIHARPTAHFAEGGLVSSAPSTPVHVHIGAATFPMSASSDVASALVLEARRSQMSSAGIKPTWYGR